MGNPEKGSNKGKGKGKAEKGGMGPRGRCAFKVLCPDALVSSVMGPRGSIKEQLQEESGCKLVVSARDEYYPGTYLRILAIYGPEPEAVLQVLERVVEKVAECGEKEKQQPPKGEHDFLGKEDGEYLFRGTISERMIKNLIGVKGCNVQAIRNETNAKVFIDNQPFQGHQLLRVIGAHDSLTMAIKMINECVQGFAEEPWFTEWSMIRCISEAPEQPFEQGHHRDRGDRERSPRRGGAERHRDSGGWETRRDDDWNAGYSNHGAVASTASQDPVDSLAQSMAETVGEFPDGALLGDFTIMCDLPSHKVSALIGKKGDHVKYVKRVTGAKVVFRDSDLSDSQTQTLIVEGPLLSVYRAHALMMKQYQETEQPAQEAPAVENLQAQISNLQQQLAAAKGSGKQGKKGKKGG